MGGRHLLQKAIELRSRDAARPFFHHFIHHFEQLWRALAGQCGDVDDRRVVEKLQVETQLVVERLCKVLPLAFHEVPFVHRDNHAAPSPLRFACDGAVLIGRAERRVNHQYDEIGIRNRTSGQQDAHRFDGSRARHAAGFADSCRVDDAELALMPAKPGVDGVSCRAGNFADEHALFAQDTIDERRLPHIRAAHDRNSRLGLFCLLLF